MWVVPSLGLRSLTKGEGEEQVENWPSSLSASWLEVQCEWLPQAPDGHDVTSNNDTNRNFYSSLDFIRYFITILRNITNTLRFCRTYLMDFCVMYTYACSRVISELNHSFELSLGISRENLIPQIWEDKHLKLITSKAGLLVASISNLLFQSLLCPGQSQLQNLSCSVMGFWVLNDSFCATAFNPQTKSNSLAFKI